MTSQDDIKRVWDILDDNSIGMLTTKCPEGMRARPLDARSDRDSGEIFFLTDVRGLKDDEIEASPNVCFTVTDKSSNTYLSITARASVVRDTAKAREIWKKNDDIWWKGGPEDPNVRVLKLVPTKAELWDGPASKLIAAYEFAKARLSGEKPFAGENTKKVVRLG
jgi:general stress protein 26